MFDPSERVAFARTPASVIGNKEHLALALQSARESIVLLQNDPAPPGFGFDRLLPLDLRRVNSIAVLGPYVDMLQFGNYNGEPANPAVTPLAGIQEAVGDRVRVVFSDDDDEDAVAKIAQESDVAILVLGINDRIESEGIDRQTLELPSRQRRLLKKVLEANPATIVVLEGGSPIGLAAVKPRVPAIIMLWYPGEQGGTALAEVLLGKTNPSGRLPVTFHNAVADLPPIDEYEIDKGRTYMYCEKPVSFPFGHGLSYTTFAYADLRLAPTTAAAPTPGPSCVPAPASNHAPATGPSSASAPARTAAMAALPALRPAADRPLTTLTFTLANTGSLGGDEVVQLYVRKTESPLKRPLKQLKAFDRVSLAPGQSRAVQFQLPLADLAFWDEPTHRFIVEPGRYELMIGPSSADIRLRTTLEIK
jgi:beta-glucosidase